MAATGLRLNSGMTLPSGRPRWLISTTPRAFVEEILDGWKGRGDPLLVLHLAVLDGDVEIHADEYALAGYLEILDEQLCHVRIRG